MADNDLTPQERLSQLQKEASQAEKSMNSAVEKNIELTLKAQALEAGGFSKKSRYYKALANAQEAMIESKREELKVTNKQTQAEQANVNALKASEKALKARSAVFNDIAKTLGNIPGIGGLLSDVFRDAAKEVEKTGNRAAGLLSVFNSIAKVAGPTAILKSMLDVSNQTQDISRNLGIGFEAAREIRKEFSQIAMDSDDVRINSIDLVKAQRQLQESFGLSAKASGEVSINFGLNSEYLGASVEAAGNLERIIAITGGNSTEFTDSLALAANETGRLYGVNLPLAKVVEKIKNIQGASLALIMKSPDALAKAVAMSEKLGIEFSKIRGLADNLVNFESSISAELEAEVFLGRDINLNKARQLAFMGDEIGLAEEIGKQIGTTAELNAMLPIQQQSFAKALGMSRDELANMVMQQELSNRFGAQARDLTVEQMQAAKELADADGISDGAALRRIQEEVSATKKFEDAAQKIRGAFQDAVVRFTPLIEKIAGVIGTLAKNPLAQFLAVGAAALGTISATSKLLSSVTGVQKVYVVNGSSGGGAGLLDSFGFGSASKKRMVSQYGKRGAKMAIRGARGGAIGLVGGLAGAAIKSQAKTAAGSAFGGGLEGAAAGAGIGMLAGPWGALAGGIIGGVYGSMTGYLDKQESLREAKREQAQKEIDQKGAVAEELRMLRSVMENKNMVIEMDSMQVGKGLTKGASLVTNNYNLGG